jgi:hypothetical protein
VVERKIAKSPHRFSWHTSSASDASADRRVQIAMIAGLLGAYWVFFGRLATQFVMLPKRVALALGLGRLLSLGFPRSLMGRNGSVDSLAPADDGASDAGDGSVVAAEELLLRARGYQSSLSML